MQEGYNNYNFSHISLLNLSPFDKSLITFFPKISDKYFGCKPKPGLTDFTFSSVTMSPVLISCATYKRL